VKYQAASLDDSAQAAELAVVVVVVAFAQNSVIVVCSGSHRISCHLVVAEVAVECFQIHPHQKARRLAEMSAQAYHHQISHRFVVVVVGAAAAGYFVQIGLFLAIVDYRQTVLPLVAVAAYFAQARRTDHQVAVEAVAECFVQTILYFVTVYCRRIVRRSAEAEKFHQRDWSSVAIEGCQIGWTS
jgi:hypothetical protein